MWFVYLSAYPQPMEQYRQLSSHGNHRSFLGIFSSSLRKLPSPSEKTSLTWVGAIRKESHAILGEGRYIAVFSDGKVHLYKKSAES
jgi:hypothetical protein